MENRALMTSRSGDELEDAATDCVSEVSLRIEGNKKPHSKNAQGAEEGARLDSKTTEASFLTQSGSQSARKTTNNHYSADSSLLQLTASQSVDLIKRSEQMRDNSESKAHSTKSSANLSAEKAASSSNYPVDTSKQQTASSCKKGAKNASNQMRKKSITSSNSRGNKNHQANSGRRGSSRDSSDD